MRRSSILIFAGALVVVGCGARTDGLLDDFGGDPTGPGLDAGFDDVSGGGVDGGGGRDGGGRDGGGGVDGGITRDGTVPIDSGGGGGIDASPVDAPVLEGCPGTLPKNLSLCSPEKTICDYAGCHPTKKDEAQCIGGQWRVHAEACVTTPDRCPIGEPVSGTPCTGFHDSELCWFDGECTEQSIGQCSGGIWSVKHGGCPPVGFCPTSIPKVDSACPKLPKGTGNLCTYVNACGFYSRIICSGDTGTWDELAEDPCTSSPPCPTTEPAIGDACLGSIKCTWPNACGSTDLMDCASGKWRMFHRGKCLEHGCPTTPLEGTGCTLPGETCTYPAGGGCSLVCDCAGGAWTCKQPPCGGGSGGK